MGYRPDIEGLRSVAVLLVVLFHFGLPEALRAGFMGVDIFFVISGYLIVPPLIDKLSKGAFSFGDFYERRIRRLAPGLIVTVVLTLLTALTLLTPMELVRFAKEAIASQLYYSNVYYWRFLNYFGLQAQAAFLLHTWSLGVEEQFYLSCPLLLWAAAKIAPSKTVHVLIAVGLLSFTLNVVIMPFKPEAIFYLFPARAWEFVLGAIIPLITSRFQQWRVPSAALSILGTVIIISSLAYYDPTILFPGWYATLPVIGTCCLLAAGADQGTMYSRMISAPPLRYIGRISYELYLVHWPIRIFLPIIVLDVSYANRVIGVLLSFVLAAAIYHLVEAPIRARRVLGQPKVLILAYFAATASVVLGLLFVIQSEGWSARFPSGAVALAAAEDDFDISYRHCESKVDDMCFIGSRDLGATWLIYGDSHADALAPAFRKYLVAHHQSAYFSFQSGCMPVVGGGDDNCRRFNDEIVRFVASHPQIKKVALISTWELADGFLNDQKALVKGRDAERSFERSLERTLNGYSDKQIVFWLPVPGARSAVPAALARNAVLNRSWDLRITKIDYERRISFFKSNLQRRTNVTTIDPARRLCATGMCQITFSGRPLYYDNAHPAASQTPLFESFIEQDLQSLR